jgi:3-oxoacyl-[acyl-carrier protein] reductase
MNCIDKVAIVTGAAGGGMGRSIALTLAREGARVVVNYRTSRANAEAICAVIAGWGGSAIAVQADVFDTAGCHALVNSTIARYGRVDICVANPGGGWHPETIDQLSPADALDDLQKEIVPLVNLMHLVLPGMYERKWGRFIAIAMHPLKVSPAFSYNLGKAARTQAVQLAHEQAWPHGVTINAIGPGPFEPIASLEEAIEQCQHSPAWLHRGNLSPQDFAEGVAFLCSEAGRFVSGCMLPYLFNH